MKNEYRTKARSLIIEYLKGHSGKRFTAKEIFDAVKDDENTVSRTTIYRNLERLCDQGNLVKFKEPNQDSWFYQYSDTYQHCNTHMHAQCAVCGRIFHLEDVFLDGFAKKMKLVYGLDMDPSKSLIIGQCESCRRKAGKKIRNVDVEQ